MTEQTAQAETEAPPPSLTVPLQSDPAWLRWGLLATSLVCIGLVALYFRTRPPPPSGPAPSLWLALIPGLALATFASAIVAFVSRRAGGTLRLEVLGARLDLIDPAQRAEMIDLARPFGALLVHDTQSARTILLLSQHGDPVMLMDPASPRGAVEGWTGHALDMDLSDVALSPATANMLTVVSGGSLLPLLREIAPRLEDATPWVLYPTPTGGPIEIFPVGVRSGDREAPAREGTTARGITMQTPAGDVTAISIVADESSFLFARQDPTGSLDTTVSDTPDAFLPPLVWALLARLYDVRGAMPAVSTSQLYRG